LNLGVDFQWSFRRRGVYGQVWLPSMVTLRDVEELERAVTAHLGAIKQSLVDNESAVSEGS
jgi:hypothetical protein